MLGYQQEREAIGAFRINSVILMALIQLTWLFVAIRAATV